MTFLFIKLSLRNSAYTILKKKEKREMKNETIGDTRTTIQITSGGPLAQNETNRDYSRKVSTQI